MRFLIEKGYIAKGCIVDDNPAHGLTGRVLRFDYKPLLPEQVAAVEGEPPARRAKAQTAAVAKQVTLWNAEADPTVENVARLDVTFWERMWMIIAGYASSDKDPEAASSEGTNSLDDAEKLEKNSSAA